MTVLAALRNVPVLLAVLIGLGLRISLAIFTPVGGASVPYVLSSYNDELAHAKYALFVLKNSALPHQVESIQGAGALERGEYENYQPPLYYLIVAAVGKAVGIHDLNSVVILGRFLGIGLCVGIALVFLRIARALSAKDSFVSAGVIFIALSGVFVCFTSMLNNEPLFWLCAGGMFLSALHMRQEGLRSSHWMMFAALACLGLYTKLTAILLLPLPIIALSNRWTPRVLVSLAGLYCLILLCVFPLSLRNLYDFGSLLPLNAGFGDPVWRVPNLSTAVYLLRSFIFPWSEIWYGGLGLMFLLPACLFFGWMCLRGGGWSSLRGQLIFFAALLIALASYLWLNMRYEQAEGRYLFAAWPSLQVALVGRPRGQANLWLLVIAMLLPYSLFILSMAGA